MNAIAPPPSIAALWHRREALRHTYHGAIDNTAPGFALLWEQIEALQTLILATSATTAEDAICQVNAVAECVSVLASSEITDVDEVKRDLRLAEAALYSASVVLLPPGDARDEAASLLQAQTACVDDAADSAQPPPPETSPDAELIALCAEFDETEILYRGLNGEGPMAHLYIEDDNELDAAFAEKQARRRDILESISERPPTTHAGQLALAHTMALLGAEGNLCGSYGGYSESMFSALMAGMAPGVGEDA